MRGQLINGGIISSWSVRYGFTKGPRPGVYSIIGTRTLPSMPSFQP